MREQGLRAMVVTATLALVGYNDAVAQQPRVRAAPVTVRYDDLDLSTASGARRMLDRIRSAATVACRNSRSNSTLGACVTASVRSAVASLGAPRVTALYRARETQQ